jgi:two-component system response regulator CpxR
MDRLLLIDDDAELSRLVARFLAGEGFETVWASCGEAGIEAALAQPYSLILLDVMMPDTGGFEVLRRIRQQSRVPVLMLTARGDTHDRVRGLEMGADDYLPKPFDPAELAARVRAILRRSVPPVAQASSVVFGDIELDPGAREVRRAGAPLDLTTVEFDLLAALLRAPGSTISREDLVRNVLRREFSPFDRSIDTHVCNLRRKLGPLAGGGDRIKGVRGSGYLYVAPARAGN